MGATARISILGLCCFVVSLNYFFVHIVTLNVDRCWKLSEFWLGDSFWLSPFWSFSAFFAMAFLWLLAEIHSLLSNSSKGAVKASMLLITLVFLVMCGIMQAALWQSLEVLDGSRRADDFWPKWTEFARFNYAKKDDDFYLLPWRERKWILDQEWRSKNQDGHPMGWHAFIWEKTCMRGVEVGLVSVEQWHAWDSEYSDTVEQFYIKQEKTLIRENLLKAYGLPSESDIPIDHP